MNIIETEQLSRRFGEVLAVDRFTVTVREGEVFGLLGPNGAGKSTVIKMLTTLLPPSSGTARVGGYDVLRQASQVRRRIGYVPQMLSADGSLTGRENLAVFASLYDIPRRERRKRVADALIFMGLSEAADKLARDYSGGMVRRLEIAQAMLHRPALLFLDEPTLGLDPIAREAVWNHIQELRQRYGTTIIVTTHYMEEADHLCERLSIMHRGRVAALGSPTELKLAVGREGATLEDVFIHYAGDALDSGGDYHDAWQARTTAGRLG